MSTQNVTVFTTIFKHQRDSNWFSRRSKVRFIEFKRSKLETKKDRKSSKIIEKCSGNMEKWCDEWKKVIEGSNYLLDIWLWLPSFAGTKFCNWCPPAYLHISSQMSSHIISVISTRAETLIFIHSVWKSQKSLIQNCERSELSLHFNWTKVH